MREKTYCNPLCIEDIPSGKWLDTNLTGESQKGLPDYRSISDPSVVYHDGKWILYPSYAVAYVTEDFVHWKHVDIGIPHLRYSPAVVQFRGKWYLTGHDVREVYVADSPIGPFSLAGYMTDEQGKPMTALDPCYFADGDHLYMYWFGIREAGAGEDAEYVSGTVGAEVDPERPWRLLQKPIWLNQFDPDCVWQCTGEHNQNRRMGWIEGQWMTKIGGRYYLLYSGNGTRYGSYAQGIAYSDEGPLSGFRNQKNHMPLTQKRDGLLRGAGHGCIVEGPNQTHWVFYSMIYNYYHPYECRVGMEPVGVDENGELYCPAVTETPQYAPGVRLHPEDGNDAALVPLTFMERPSASSAVSGRDALYAADDSILTWWQPEEDDPEKCITFTLGTRSAYVLESLRILWRDIGMDAQKGVCPGAYQYVVEYAPDAGAETWKTLVDASENQKDLCVDYRCFEPTTAYRVRMRILGAPRGIQPGLVSLTVFGTVKCGKDGM